MFSVTRLCNFHRTRQNAKILTELAFGNKYLFGEKNDLNETRKEGPHVHSKNIATRCSYLPALVLGSIVGLTCEATGAVVDCSCQFLTFGKLNMQKTQLGYCNEEDYEGSGVLQGCLGEFGTNVGNILGSVAVGVPLYITTYVTTLPFNCCHYYCCLQSPEQASLLKGPDQQNMQL